MFSNGDFERHGVVHYLIVDPDKSSVERFHRDADGNLIPIQLGNPLEFMIRDDGHLKLNVESLFSK